MPVGRPVQVSPEERERIIEALQAGRSQNEVARAFGRGPATINRIAAPLALEYSAPKAALAARADYTLERRLDLLNAGFDKAVELLDGIERPAELQQWATAFGILTDKRRLEDGDVTSRSEVTNGDDERTRVASKLDELAARRGTREMAS